ncbi:histone acetyltransferases subunit 3-domain-containing protein [Dichotomocladium elegans]|nr:histone acetyltransferases subunit 3-domain-containing protein [Dichotomocladium elegans]
MDSDSSYSNLTQHYSLPTPVSQSTALYYRNQQASRNSNNASTHGSSPSPNLPGVSDLSSIKTDLERVLSRAEMRLRQLKKDINNLDKNVKIHNNDESDDDNKHGGGVSGKNVSAMLEKMRIKREQNDDVYSKVQSDRHAALEVLRQRRKRDDSSEDDLVSNSTTRSESPLGIVKSKKLENMAPITSRSASPPPAPSGKHHLPKPHETSQHKKKKTSKAMSRANGEHQGKHPKAKSQQRIENDVDFVRVKPKDQVPILTFWSGMEPYFRPLTEEDRKFLLEKGDDVKPYLIPPLGRHYREVWAEQAAESGLPSSSSSTSTTRGRSNSPAPISNNGNGVTGRAPHPDAQAASETAETAATKQEPVRYLRSTENFTDDFLLTNDLSCGSLAERLLSSLVIEELVDAEELRMIAKEEDEENEEGDPMDLDASSTSSFPGRTITELTSEQPEEIVEFEERLKRELRYAGLFGDDDIDWNAREDDEICAELRRLGRELEEQVKINEFRKSRLLEVVDQQLQFEQYRNVLDTYDQQVEQCYAKRFVSILQQRWMRREAPDVLYSPESTKV